MQHSVKSIANSRACEGAQQCNHEQKNCDEPLAAICLFHRSTPLRGQVANFDRLQHGCVSYVPSVDVDRQAAFKAPVCAALRIALVSGCRSTTAIVMRLMLPWELNSM